MNPHILLKGFTFLCLPALQGQKWNLFLLQHTVAESNMSTGGQTNALSVSFVSPKPVAPADPIANNVTALNIYYYLVVAFFQRAWYEF